MIRKGFERFHQSVRYFSKTILRTREFTFTLAAARSIASPAIKATHPDFLYPPIAEPEELGNGGGADGYRAALVRRQLTPGLISSSSGMAGLPPFISFSTSYPELDDLRRCETGLAGLLQKEIESWSAS